MCNIPKTCYPKPHLLHAHGTIIPGCWHVLIVVDALFRQNTCAEISYFLLNWIHTPHGCYTPLFEVHYSYDKDIVPEDFVPAMRKEGERTGWRFTLAKTQVFTTIT